jgi:hypothetical protein
MEFWNIGAIEVFANCLLPFANFSLIGQLVVPGG